MPAHSTRPPARSQAQNAPAATDGCDRRGYLLECSPVKCFAALLALVPTLLLAAGAESEKFVWKDCPSDIRVHAIREFMEIVQRDDLVVYSTSPGKLSGVCGRAKAPEIRAKLAAQAASAAKSAASAARAAAARARAADPSAEQVYSFSLAELLDPDRELWLVRRLVPADRRAGSDLEDGSDAVVFFGGTDKQGSLVVGQKLRGVLVPRGVHTVTNDYRREVFGGDGWERKRNVERLRRFHWRADRAERPEAAGAGDGGEKEPDAPDVYFRTFGINYLNADHVFPLWLRARGGSFKTTIKAQKTCEKCGGRGRWTEWKGTVQQPVVCSACGGNGSVEILKTYEFVPEGPNARRKVPFQ